MAISVHDADTNKKLSSNANYNEVNRVKSIDSYGKIYQQFK